MAVAHFVFTAFRGSFKVSIPNLESLSVEDIQKIEEFVAARKGIFDFNTYAFTIQKRLDFFEFESLIKESAIQARCVDKPVEAKERARVGFGEYKGMFYSELPDSYLIWLKTNYAGKDKKTIETEVQKRNL